MTVRKPGLVAVLPEARCRLLKARDFEAVTRKGVTDAAGGKQAVPGKARLVAGVGFDPGLVGGDRACKA